MKRILTPTTKKLMGIKNGEQDNAIDVENLYNVVAVPYIAKLREFYDLTNDPAVANTFDEAYERKENNDNLKGLYKAIVDAETIILNTRRKLENDIKKFKP